MLIKWRGLDYAQLSWLPWARARRLCGAAEAWRRCHALLVRPPLPAPSDEMRAVERSRPFRPQTEPELQLPPGRALRSYQLEGINWLLACWHAGRSAILADEMGLGKTCQLLLTLEWLSRHRNVQGPFLVVAPVSTLAHWEREVRAWTSLHAALFH